MRPGPRTGRLTATRMDSAVRVSFELAAVGGVPGDVGHELGDDEQDILQRVGHTASAPTSAGRSPTPCDNRRITTG